MRGEGRGRFQVLLKNKLLSEMFDEKKSLSTKMFFPTITKNLNWEILTKNLLDSLQNLTGGEEERRQDEGVGKKEGSGVFKGGLILQYTLW